MERNYLADTCRYTTIREVFTSANDQYTSHYTYILHHRLAVIIVTPHRYCLVMQMAGVMAVALGVVMVEIGVMDMMATDLVVEDMIKDTGVDMEVQ